MSCKIAMAESLIKAACVLHNFIRIKEGIFSRPSQPSTINCIGYQNIQVQGLTTRATRAAETHRDILCSYFASNQGKVPWQENVS